jgi:hypothetical protein
VKASNLKRENKLAMKIKMIAAGLAACVSTSVAHAQLDEWVDRIDRVALESGEIHLGLFYEGEADGFMRLGWNTQDNVVSLFDRSMWASNELYESLEGTLAADNFAPDSFSIRFHRQSAYFLLDVNYQPGRVEGTTRVIRPGQETAERPISADIPEGTIARAAMFLFAAVTPMDVGESVSFDWFSPMTGAVEAVTLTAVDEQQVETPAGTFQTVRLEQRGGSPANDIFVDTASGRIVRIDIDGQPMQFLALPDPQ